MEQQELVVLWTSVTGVGGSIPLAVNLHIELAAGRFDHLEGSKMNGKEERESYYMSHVAAHW